MSQVRPGVDDGEACPLGSGNGPPGAQESGLHWWIRNADVAAWEE